jgi:hypothetical protein
VFHWEERTAITRAYQGTYRALVEKLAKKHPESCVENLALSCLFKTNSMAGEKPPATRGTFHPPTANVLQSLDLNTGRFGQRPRLHANHSRSARSKIPNPGSLEGFAEQCCSIKKI